MNPSSVLLRKEGVPYFVNNKARQPRWCHTMRTNWGHAVYPWEMLKFTTGTSRAGLVHQQFRLRHVCSSTFFLFLSTRRLCANHSEKPLFCEKLHRIDASSRVWHGVKFIALPFCQLRSIVKVPAISVKEPHLDRIRGAWCWASFHAGLSLSTTGSRRCRFWSIDYLFCRSWKTHPVVAVKTNKMVWLKLNRIWGDKQNIKSEDVIQNYSLLALLLMHFLWLILP